jgi:DNA (cytosine-5)-methyltransferase 1
MTQSPEDILIAAYNSAKKQSVSTLLSALPDECVQELRIIAKNAEILKGVVGVTLTSIAYKVLNPSQDIRYHQDHMQNGYSGRTFDTKYVTPFLKEKFRHFAMAESAWLTRSLEQPHPYDSKYPRQNPKQRSKSGFSQHIESLASE